MMMEEILNITERIEGENGIFGLEGHGMQNVLLGIF